MEDRGSLETVGRWEIFDFQSFQWSEGRGKGGR